MKKVISLMLAATMALGICACGNSSSGGTTDITTDPNATSGTTAATTQSPFLVPGSEDFDAENIVLQFAAVSDVHIASGHATNPQGRVKSAFEQLKEAALLYTDKGLDAVIVAGDLTDDYGSDQGVKSAEITALKNVYESVFSPSQVPMLYALGNHDHDFERNGGAGSDLNTFLNVMGNREAHTQYDVDCSDAAHGSRHAVIGNYHFLFVEPITYACNGADDTGAKFYEATKTWLDNELKAITEANPDQYVFVITHPMLYGTVYGSDLLTSGIYWYTKDLNDILNKYPQVVTFGGHLHFPINDERSIMQTGFTALGCGSVQYMAIDDGGYDDMASATTMKDKGYVSSGYLVQVDNAGNVRFIRMDFQSKTTIKDPFVIETPAADGSHLDKYSNDRGNAENNASPVIAPNAISIKDNADTDDEILAVTLNFAAGTDDDLIHHYVVEVYDNGKLVETRKILTDYYRHGDVSNMKTAYEVKLNATFSRGGKYEIRLTAYDCWDAASETIVYKYEPVLDVSSVVLPDAYADIEFANGTATDKNGKISIELVGGATVAEGTYTFAGVTKTLTGINIKGGSQYAKLTFNGITSVDAMDTLLKPGFAVEMIYVNRSKSGTQGLFSGYGAKGFGVYEKDGAPAIKVFRAKEFKETVADAATSSEELVHVLATYARNSGVLAVYVNGEQTRTTVTGFPKSEGAVFALGANIAANGTVSDCASDLSIVDVKFYSEMFSQAQAFVRYQNVLAEYKGN